MQFLGVIKNCIRSGKILWCGTFAMQALVYLACSIKEKYVNLVNSVSGGFLEEL